MTAPINRLLTFSLIAAVALAIVGCASGPRLTAPTVSIAEARLTENQGVQLRVRIRNDGELSMRAARLDLTLREEGQILLSVSPELDLVIAAGGIETVSINAGAEAASLRKRLESLDRTAREEMRFRIVGNVVLASSGRKFEFSERETLSPTPGRPGSFR